MPLRTATRGECRRTFRRSDAPKTAPEGPQGIYPWGPFSFGAPGGTEPAAISCVALSNFRHAALKASSGGSLGIIPVGVSSSSKSSPHPSLPSETLSSSRLRSPEPRLSCPLRVVALSGLCRTGGIGLALIPLGFRLPPAGLSFPLRLSMTLSHRHFSKVHRESK